MCVDISYIKNAYAGPATGVHCLCSGRFGFTMKKPFLIILPLLLIFGCSPKPKDFKSLLIGKWKRENSQDTLEIKKDMDHLLPCEIFFQ